MAKNKNKTTQNEKSVEDFLNAIADETKRTDSYALIKIMQEITGESPKMWGGSIIGFGSYHYKYESGREGDMPIVGFSPRKTALTLYIMNGFARYDELLTQLGKHKIGKSCLYIKKLADVDSTVLNEMITLSVAYMTDKYSK